jgi:hypothetical protein
MSKEIPTARYILHKVCAYPYAICWIAGTLLLWTSLSFQFSWMGAFSGPGNDWASYALLFLCYACTSGLAFFGGAFFISWYVVPRCRRFNGAPHEVGERVIVLSGRHSGTSTVIAEVTRGQGGLPLLRVDPGSNVKESFGDLFEEYELLRLSSRAEDNAGALPPR